MNEHFELVFGIVYTVIIFAIFVAIIFQIHYWILSDSPTSRNLVPISFLIASIANFCLVLWIIIYIYGIHKDDDVEV